MITTRDLQGIPVDFDSAGVVTEYLSDTVLVEHHLHRFVQKGRWFECHFIYRDGIVCGTRLSWAGTVPSWVARAIELTKPPASSSVPQTKSESSSTSVD